MYHLKIACIGLLTVLFVLMFSLNCLAQVAPLVEIARYRQNKACAISYTFDDGLKEHYTLVTPWLNQLGFKATFVINGKVINNDNDIRDTTRMTWGELKKMAARGHEISNHGWAHKNFGKFPLGEIKQDILRNDSAILANIGIRPLTFAYPNNTKTKDGVILASQNRVGTRLFQRSLGGKSSSADLDNWLNKLIQNREWGVTMTHGITYGYDKFSSPGLLLSHLQKVKTLQNLVWVGTFRSVVSYITERDSTSVEVKLKEPGIFVMSLTCTLDKKIFTEKLTAIIKAFPGQISGVKQGREKLVMTKTSEGMLFDFDPFGAPVLITINNKK